MKLSLVETIAASVVIVIVLFALALFSNKLVGGTISRIDIPTVQRMYQPGIDTCVTNHLEASESLNVGGPMQNKQTLRESVLTASDMCGKGAVSETVLRGAALIISIVGMLLVSRPAFFNLFRRLTEQNNRGDLLKLLSNLNIFSMFCALLLLIPGVYMIVLSVTDPAPAVKFVHALAFSGRFIMFYSAAIVAGVVVAVLSNFFKGGPPQEMPAT